MAKKNTKELEGVSTSAPEKKPLKRGEKSKMDKTKSAIIGIGLLFAVASIVYSTSVIVLGTEGIVPLIMLIPQAILALVILIKQFLKN